MTWQDAAACKGQTALFFTRDDETPLERAARVRAAKKLCAACRVHDECEEAAGQEQAGIWAGKARTIRVQRLDVPLRPGSSTSTGRRQERNRRQNERRALYGRPDKARDWSKRWLARLRLEALSESMRLRQELWADQQVSA